MSKSYKYDRLTPIEPLAALYTAADRETPAASLHSRLTSRQYKQEWSDYFKHRQMKSILEAFGGKQQEATDALNSQRLAHELRIMGTFVINAVDGSFFGMAHVNPDPVLSQRKNTTLRLPIALRQFLALPHPGNVVRSPQVTTGPLVRAWTIADETLPGQVALKNAYAALSDPNGIASEFFAKYASLHSDQTEPVMPYTVEPIHNATQGIHITITKAGFRHVDTGYYGDSESIVSFPPISRLYVGQSLDI